MLSLRRQRRLLQLGIPWNRYYSTTSGISPPAPTSPLTITGDASTNTMELPPSITDPSMPSQPSPAPSPFLEPLEREGLTHQQAEALLSQMHTATDTSYGELRRNMVARAEQEKAVSNYRLDFAHLKSEIHLLEKNDFAILKQENERIAAEAEKLKTKMREDLQRFQAGVRLDMNLDAARVGDEQTVLKTQIQNVEMRLEEQVRRLKKDVESVRLRIIRTIAAAAGSFGLAVLGWARFYNKDEE